jgi:hypothetical protein
MKIIFRAWCEIISPLLVFFTNKLAPGKGDAGEKAEMK